MTPCSTREVRCDIVERFRSGVSLVKLVVAARSRAAAASLAASAAACAAARAAAFSAFIVARASGVMYFEAGASSRCLVGMGPKVPAAVKMSSPACAGVS